VNLREIIREFEASVISMKLPYRNKKSIIDQAKDFLLYRPEHTINLSSVVVNKGDNDETYIVSIVTTTMTQEIRMTLAL